MANYRTRPDHRPAILKLLRKRTRRLAELVAALGTDDTSAPVALYHAIAYDLKCLYRDGIIEPHVGAWRIARADR